MFLLQIFKSVPYSCPIMLKIHPWIKVKMKPLYLKSVLFKFEEIVPNGSGVILILILIGQQKTGQLFIYLFFLIGYCEKKLLRAWLFLLFMVHLSWSFK